MRANNRLRLKTIDVIIKSYGRRQKNTFSNCEETFWVRENFLLIIIITAAILWSSFKWELFQVQFHAFLSRIHIFVHWAHHHLYIVILKKMKTKRNDTNNVMRSERKGSSAHIDLLPTNSFFFNFFLPICFNNSILLDISIRVQQYVVITKTLLSHDMSSGATRGKKFLWLLLSENITTIIWEHLVASWLY